MKSIRIERKNRGAWWWIIIGFSLIVSRHDAAGASITVDGKTEKGSLPHFWSECVGCGSMEMCMRQDVKAHFKMAAEELGMKRVRGHGMIDGWMSPSHGKMGIFKLDGTKPTYNWKNYDSVVNTIKSVGMQPAVELSFSPAGLRSIPSKSSCKPNDYNVWRDLVYEIVKHSIETWGLQEVRSWYWEVWNEPDNHDFFDVGGDKEAQLREYNTLYDKAVEGALKADSLIQIGGPATCTSIPETDFINHCIAAKTKITFLSNHAYAAGTGNDVVNAEGICGDNRARFQIIKKSKLPLKSVNTEYNTTWAGQGGNSAATCKSMDHHFNAIFAAKVVKYFLDDHMRNVTVAPETTSTCAPLPAILSYWVISDIFDEGWYIENYNKSHNANLPFGQVFGMITYQGIRKAVFNGFKMLNKMGSTRLALTGNVSGADGVDAFATLSSRKDSLCVLVFNYYNKISTTGNDNVTVTINNIPFSKGKMKVTHYRVDETHSNPYKVWQGQGSPTSPGTSQLEALKAAGNLAEIEPQAEIDFQGATYSKTFDLPKQGMSLLILSSGVVQTHFAEKCKNLRGTIAVQGSRVSVGAEAGDRVRVTLHGLDGKLLAEEAFDGKGSIDASRYHAAKGFCIVRAETDGQRVSRKVFIR